MRRKEPSRLTIADRLTYACIGAVFGALLGLLLAWMAGTSSRTFGGASRTLMDTGRWIGGSAVGFGLAGLIFGPYAGTLVGTLINVLFQVERGSIGEMPRWSILLVVIAVAAGVWWYVR